MTGLATSVRALLLAALATVSVHGNPIELRATTTTITPCATVKCTATTSCQVIDGKALCVPNGATKCGSTYCDAGLTCCNASCGMCVKPGMMCTQQVCEPTVTLTPSPVGTPCGAAVCKPGLECCNASCGTCVEPGKGCTKQLCLPTGPQCGKTVCASGYVCCNASCGVCTPPDGACTMQVCADAS